MYLSDHVDEKIEAPLDSLQRAQLETYLSKVMDELTKH